MYALWKKSPKLVNKNFTFIYILAENIQVPLYDFISKFQLCNAVLSTIVTIFKWDLQTLFIL